MNVEFLRRLYLQEGETNMNSLKDAVAVATDAMYVILGASGRLGKDKGSSRRHITAAMRRDHALD